jgi:SET family sugar efflux transporter-like MFS transporter
MPTENQIEPVPLSKLAKVTLLFLLTGVICNAAIVPYMSVYIVETLGKDPWMISLYAMITLTLTLFVNRQYGEWIDAGHRIAPLLLTSICAFGLAISSILLMPTYWMLVCFAGPCFAVSNASVSAMYSFGRLLADREGLDVPRYNAYLRSMTSLGWMLAPAASFYIASVAGGLSVFWFALALCGIWAVLWWFVVPKSFATEMRSSANESSESDHEVRNVGLWLAAGVCLSFAMAHSMTMSALPLFYIREAGLPAYAPGLSLSVKTAVEIIAILLAPMIMMKLGARNALRSAAVLAAIAFIILARVSTLPQMFAGAALEGLYYGLFAAIGLSFIQDFAKGRMARATSLYMNSLFLGGLLASPLMGLTAQFVSFQMAIQLSTIWVVIAFIILTKMKIGGRT